MNITGDIELNSKRHFYLSFCQYLIGQPPPPNELEELPETDKENWSTVFMTGFHPIADEQDATILVEYEVEKETGGSKCLCSACENDSPLDLSPSTSLNDDFRRLFLSPESSDVIFIVGEEKIPAHKLVLTTRVPYFQRLFASSK